MMRAWERDGEWVVIAQMHLASGYFAQGDTFEDARASLRDVIEGNILLAFQLRYNIRNKVYDNLSTRPPLRVPTADQVQSFPGHLNCVASRDQSQPLSATPTCAPQGPT